MREILFRGKRMDNKAWEDGSLVITRGGCYDQQVFISDKMTGYHTPVIPETVSQFTGLTDKNGRKIFEGDIVRYGQRGKVEYNSGSAQFTLNFTNGIYEGFDKIPFCDCEVLGNIYDNPELLEGS